MRDRRAGKPDAGRVLRNEKNGRNEKSKPEKISKRGTEPDGRYEMITEKPLSIGTDDFKKLVGGGCYYIDKTLLIKEILLR